MEEAPYETPILNFRRLLENHKLAYVILAVINGHLGDRGEDCQRMRRRW